MRPVVHPPIETVTVEGILHALSDPTRVAIFGQIAGSSCTANCTTFSHVGDKPIPKSTLSQHFKVLRDAGLIRSERVGVEMQSSSRCQEVDARFPGLIAAILNSLKLQAAACAASKKTAAKGRAKTA